MDLDVSRVIILVKTIDLQCVHYAFCSVGISRDSDYQMLLFCLLTADSRSIQTRSSKNNNVATGLMYYHRIPLGSNVQLSLRSNVPLSLRSNVPLSLRSNVPLSLRSNVPLSPLVQCTNYPLGSNVPTIPSGPMYQLSPRVQCTNYPLGSNVPTIPSGPPMYPIGSHVYYISLGSNVVPCEMIFIAVTKIIDYHH